MTDIMPCDRKWDQPTEELGNQLLNGANGGDERAALYILFRDKDTIWARADFKSMYVHGVADDEAVIDWHTLGLDLSMGMPPIEMSANQTAMLQICCRLAGDMGHALDLLDTDTVRHVMDAMRVAVGR